MEDPGRGKSHVTDAAVSGTVYSVLAACLQHVSGIVSGTVSGQSRRMPYKAADFRGPVPGMGAPKMARSEAHSRCSEKCLANSRKARLPGALPRSAVPG